MNTYRIFYKYLDSEQGISVDFTELEGKNKQDVEDLFWDINLEEDLEDLEVLSIDPMDIIYVILPDSDFAKLRQGKTIYQTQNGVEVRVSREQDLPY